MKRKWKITLGVSISIIVIIGGIAGGSKLYDYLQDINQVYIDDDPILAFPVENISSLTLIFGYNMTDQETGHNGFDFIVNSTTNILASCNMTVNDKEAIYNEIYEFWAIGVSFDINDAFELLIGFENFNSSEAAGQQQLDAIVVEVGQVVTQGELIGQLLYMSPYTLIHYSLLKNGKAVCPYLYFSPEAKATFDLLWPQIGSSTDPCNGTTLCF